MLGAAEPRINILLVEDSPGDVRLIREVLADGELDSQLHVAHDGEQALAFVRRESGYADVPRPDLILLDMNLPRLNGRDVLAALRSDTDLSHIPVVMLTTSAAESDVVGSYELGANSYVTKPMELGAFVDAIRAIERFWLSTACLPRT